MHFFYISMKWACLQLIPGVAIKRFVSLAGLGSDGKGIEYLCTYLAVNGH